MEFEEFTTEFITSLKTNNKNCLKLIEGHKTLVQANLVENATPENINKYVEEINKALLQTKRKFSVFEKILKYETFSKVLAEWKNSDVLVKACKNEKKDVIKWLLTMDINTTIQDEDGMTALMYAVKNPHLIIAVKLLSFRSDDLNLVDKNGENAVFHALKNLSALKELLRTKIDVNQLNKNNETALLYCCKNDIFEPIKYLINRKDLNVNVADNDERTPAMYLAEKGKNSELRSLETLHCNYDFVNSKNESVLSLVINKMYNPTEKCSTELYSEYLRIIVSLVHFNCNFNLPVDEDGNTAIMVFMLIPDFLTLQYVIKKVDDIDFTIQNKYGESASSLSKKLGNQHDVLKLINENPTYVTADNKKVKAENAEVIKETPTKINTNNKYQEFEMTKSLEKLTKRVYYESDIYLDPRNEIFTKYQVDEMNYWVFA
ncbi:ankyrin [Neocallimastix sp. 'constans']|jgi:ankyrin repeat protein